MKLTQLWMGLALALVVTVGSAGAVDNWAGEYDVHVKGSNYYFETAPRIRPIEDRTTISIQQNGNEVVVTFGTFASSSAATVFHGKVGNNMICANWWFQGSPHETKVLWGHGTANGFRGQLIYPRTARNLVPGWTYIDFEATRKREITVRPGGRPGLRPDRRPGRRPPQLAEDCVPFNWRRVTVARVGGSWKVVEGSHWIMDFGPREDEARKALGVIKRYRLDAQCFVGRPNPSMQYFKSNGRAPAGAMRGEDAIGFSPDRIEVKLVNGTWKIVEGSHWMMDFGQKEDEARKAFDIIRHYRFDHICFVGRPNPSMTYFRK